MNKAVGINFDTIQEKRLSNLRRNHKLLMDNLSPVNVTKYVDYIEQKPYLELVEDFECVYTVPNPRVWDLILKMVRFFSDESPCIVSLRKMRDHINEFREGYEARGLTEFSDHIAATLELLNSGILNLNTKNTDNARDAYIDSLGLQPGSDLENAIISHMEAVAFLLESDEKTSDEDIMEKADQMVKAEEKISQTKDLVLNNGPEEEPEVSPEQANAIKEGLIKAFKPYEIGKELMTLEHANPDECKRDMMLAYGKIMSDSHYNRSNYDVLYDKIEKIRGVGLANDNERLSELANESLYYLAATRLKVAKEMGVDNMFNGTELREFITDEEVSNVDLVDVSDIAELEEEADLDEIPVPSVTEALAVYNEARFNWITDMDDPTMESLKTMVRSLQDIQTVFEDSGRNSMAAKFARKKEELARKGVSFLRKSSAKAQHAAVASKKAAEHVNNFVSAAIQKTIDEPYAQKREEIIKGGFRIKLMGILKKAARSGVAFAINPILGIITLLSTVAKDATVDARVRAQIVKDMKDELKMIDEKIEDAKSDGNKKEKYQLMRMKIKYERELDRISKHREKFDKGSTLDNKVGD